MVNEKELTPKQRARIKMLNSLNIQPPAPDSYLDALDIYDEEIAIQYQIPSESDKKEFRCIEIRVLDIEKDIIFEASGNVNRETSHKFIEGVGYAFTPIEKPLYPRAVALPISRGKISCERTMYCTDYPEKCSECACNKTMSYFKSKE